MDCDDDLDFVVAGGENDDLLPMSWFEGDISTTSSTCRVTDPEGTQLGPRGDGDGNGDGDKTGLGCSAVGSMSTIALG